MALVTTPGGATADSYATVAEADAYIAIRGFATAWPALEADKEKLLKWAALLMNTWVWLGSATTSTQALAWPRSSLYDPSGYALDENTIPAAIKNAQIEFAFQLKGSDWSQGLGPIAEQYVKIGPIEVKNEYYRPIPSSVLAFVQAYMAGSPGVMLNVVRG